MVIPASDARDRVRGDRVRRVGVLVTVGLLLALHAGLALGSLRRKSLTFDEIAVLVGGASQWAYGDYRLNPEAGTLPQRWAALPLFLAGVTPPDRDDAAWARADPWRLGNRWLYHSGQDADAVLQAARSMLVAASVAFGLLVFACARSLWGTSGGLVSLAAFSLSPTLLAHARLASADLAAGGLLLAAVWSVERVVRRATPARAVACALAVAALLLTTPSGLVIGPTAALVVACVLVSRSVTRWRLPGGAHGGVRGARRASLLALVALVVTTSVWALVWGAYGLRFAPTAAGDPAPTAASVPSWSELLATGGIRAALLDALRGAQLLPEAFLYGWAHALHGGAPRPAFLLGEYSTTGFRSALPVLLGAKTQPAIFALLAIGGLALARASSRQRATLAWRALPFALLIAVYASAELVGPVAISSHRQLLPIELALIVLLGAAGWRLARASHLRRGLVLASLAGMGLGAVGTWPDYLAYWSPLVGGSARGYRIAVDSSLDWGQDLTALRDELARQRAADESDPVFLAYYGSASPPYHTITARRLTSYLTPDWDHPDSQPLVGGRYWISATELQNLYGRAPGHWTRDAEWHYQLLRGLARAAIAAEQDGTRDELVGAVGGEQALAQELALFVDLRFARLAAFLREREPDRRFGGSIHEYRLSDEEVRAFTEGPSPPQHEHSGLEPP